ncbi:MAG: ATP-binding protein [Ignavibacteriae bacterium]|nr:MAG: ATP-binding protein [Ignavibacteriota bacterium]
MQDISLHILDIAENSIKAGANFIEIAINEDTEKNSLTIEIRDNGKGMSSEMAAKVKDPFTTSRTERKVGLGLSLLEQAAIAAGGKVTVESEEGKGTTVKAEFMYDHIDRKPMGKITDTLISLLSNENNIDIKYTHKKNTGEFEFVSTQLKSLLGLNSLKDSKVLIVLKEIINSKLEEIS